MQLPGAQSCGTGGPARGTGSPRCVFAQCRSFPVPGRADVEGLSSATVATVPPWEKTAR